MCFPRPNLLMLLILALLASSPVFAQEKVGTAVVDGRKVDLLSNGRWEFSDARNTNQERSNECDIIKSVLVFCGKDKGWTKLERNSAEVSAQYSFDDRTYALFIVEEVGEDDGFSTELIVKAAIDNFAEFAEISREEVIIFDVEETRLDSREAVTISYGGAVDGLNVVYRSTIIVTADVSIQAAVYTFGKSLTETHRARHAEFIEQVGFR